MRRRFWLAPVLLAAALSQPALAVVDRHPGSSAAAPTTAAWWAAFEDPLLGRLVQGAAPAPAAQLAVVQSYVALRVAQARQGLAGKLQQAASEQQALLQQVQETSDERSRWIANAAARVQHWAGVQQLMASERERAEVALAALTRNELPALQQLLAGVDPDSPLPQVRLELPARQPTADLAEDAAPSPLQSLQNSHAQAQQAARMVQASELELRARQLRQQAGADTDVGVLEAYQRLVSDADRLAALTGAVALAWAQWLQSNGGDVVAELRGTARAPRAR